MCLSVLASATHYDGCFTLNVNKQSQRGVCAHECNSNYTLCGMHQQPFFGSGLPHFLHKLTASTAQLVPWKQLQFRISTSKGSKRSKAAIFTARSASLAARFAFLVARLASWAAARLAASAATFAAEAAAAAARGVRTNESEATLGQLAVAWVFLPQRRQLSLVNLNIMTAATISMQLSAL
jgi:hypothetical protein